MALKRDDKAVKFAGYRGIQVSIRGRTGIFVLSSPVVPVWVLVDVMKKKQVEEHFPASKEEYPVRIVFYGEGEIFDILYISEAEVTVVNNLFSRKKIDSCGHIIVVENPDYISAIHIADVIGYCVVKEGGEVEYYQYSQGGSEE